MNKHGKFWLSIGSLVIFVETLIFLIYGATSSNPDWTVSFRKEWCLLGIPNLALMLWSFCENYFSLTEGRD